MKMMGLITVLAIGAICAAAGWQSLNGSSPARGSKVGTRPGGVGDGTPLKPAPGNQLGAFSGGCFWGVEERFRHIPGVVATAVGYTGGTTQHPTYEQVCAHNTGHVETVLVEFDPKKVSYDVLVDAFWAMHNPTTGDRQGPDVGPNYRPAIWYFDENQHKALIAAREREHKKLGKAIATQIHAAAQFWLAEEYHQQYDEKNGLEACPIYGGG